LFFFQCLFPCYPNSRFFFCVFFEAGYFPSVFCGTLKVPPCPRFSVWLEIPTSLAPAVLPKDDFCYAGCTSRYLARSQCLVCPLGPVSMSFLNWLSGFGSHACLSSFFSFLWSVITASALFLHPCGTSRRPFLRPFAFSWILPLEKKVGPIFDRC